ncbi:PREDICTED: transcription factor HES-1-like [Priapulus caudatus]|uniref:Transcription factor HES-1-like n=1 Tax=Priapulus caudatus TaxID=37621 RepID=A0ABM1ERN9_PRICU|nr:PREDICTED: transcription factor HES-1-like [Priapulus caudatus]
MQEDSLQDVKPSAALVTSVGKSATKPDRKTSRHSKLEKADILEMTVKYLQTLQRQQMAAAASDDPSVLGRYRAGFSECTQEVTRYVNNVNGIDNSVKLRLLDHLARSMTQRPDATAAAAAQTQHANILPATAAPPAFTVATTAAGDATGNAIAQAVQSIRGGVGGGYVFPADFPAGALAVQPLPGNGAPHVVAPADVNNNNVGGGGGAAGARIFGGLQVIPGRLPSGELAFVLPGNVAGQLVPLYAGAAMTLNSFTSVPSGGATPRELSLQYTSPVTSPNNTCAASPSTSSSSSSSSLSSSSRATPPTSPTLANDNGDPVKTDDDVWRPW